MLQHASEKSEFWVFATKAKKIKRFSVDQRNTTDTANTTNTNNQNKNDNNNNNNSNNNNTNNNNNPKQKEDDSFNIIERLKEVESEISDLGRTTNFPFQVMDQLMDRYVSWG